MMQTWGILHQEAGAAPAAHPPVAVALARCKSTLAARVGLLVPVGGTSLAQATVVAMAQVAVLAAAVVAATTAAHPNLAARLSVHQL